MTKSSDRITTVIMTLIVILFAIATITLRKQRSQQVESLATMTDTPWALHSAKVKRSTLSREFLALATLHGSTEITLSSQISGTIEKMGPREGVMVHQGDLLVQISVAELKEQRAGLVAQLQAAKADVSRTQDEFQRQQNLQQKGLTTEELFEAKKTAALAASKQVKQLQKQISALDVRIGYGRITAPQTSMVAARLAEPGDTALPGKTLYQLTVDSAARLQVKLPQQILDQVHQGTLVILEYGTKQQSITLSRIFPALDPHALGTAEADLDHMPFALPSGARIPARVVLESVSNALSVPQQAVIQTAQNGFVFKVVPNKQAHVQRLPVKIVLNTHQGIAVESPELKEGDQVIVAHDSVLLQLSDQDPVITTLFKDTNKGNPP